MDRKKTKHRMIFSEEICIMKFSHHVISLSILQVHRTLNKKSSIPIMFTMPRLTRLQFPKNEPCAAYLQCQDISTFCYLILAIVWKIYSTLERDHQARTITFGDDDACCHAWYWRSSLHLVIVYALMISIRSLLNFFKFEPLAKEYLIGVATSL